MANFLEITRAIAGHLSTLTGGWPIAYPNLAYEPTTGTDYLRLSFIPALTEQADLGTNGLNSNIGIAQVDVFSAGQDGWSEAFDKADDIAEHFKRGTKLTNGGIVVTIQSVELGPPLNEGGWYQLPISINYRAYTEN